MQIVLSANLFLQLNLFEQTTLVYVTYTPNILYILRVHSYSTGQQLLQCFMRQ